MLSKSSRLPSLASRRFTYLAAALFTLVLVVLTLRSLNSYDAAFTTVVGYGPSQWSVPGLKGAQDDEAAKINTDDNKDNSNKDNNSNDNNIDNNNNDDGPTADSPSAPSLDISTDISMSSLDLPDEYYIQATNNQPPTCEDRFGSSYLQELRHTRATYCSPESPSQLTCFHNNNGANHKGGRTDSFCIAQGAMFNQTSTKFQIACETLAEPRGAETKEPSPKLESFGRYWYDTGPRVVMDRALALVAPKDKKQRDAESSSSSSAPSTSPAASKREKFTILLKREGELNPWHCLLEILSLTFSMDVLRMTPQQQQDKTAADSVWTLAHAENTQVVILDERLDGPYFDLWQLFAKKPIVRISELSGSPSAHDDIDGEMGNVIIPLPGASNPLWQGDWDPNPCRHSVLLKTFAWRVLRYYDIPDTLEDYGDGSSVGAENRVSEEKDKVVVTFIDRRGQRKLVDMDSHIAALRDRYENKDEQQQQQQHVVIHVVDLAALPFHEQIELVRNSDVLAGVHGAGLTHGLWMKEHSAMVEILPEELNHKGFRNFAGVLGHDYFSTHGNKVEDNSGNWQHDDVSIEQERFLELMDLAIKSMYNKGRLNYDVI